jgi:dolichol-phosphate mannosyltransferase
VLGNDAAFIETLGLRDRYLQHRDPIAEDRMLWRAQTFRHMMHLLPGQTILELGCGQGMFTRQLARASRGENSITAVTFASDSTMPAALPIQVEFLTASSLPGPLEGRRFDFIISSKS